MKSYFFSNGLKQFFYICLLILIFFLIGQFSYEFINPHPVKKIIEGKANRDFFYFIVLVEDDDHHLVSASIISYHFHKSHIHVFNIPNYVHFKNEKGEYKILNLFTPKELINSLKGSFEVDFDFWVSIRKSKWHALIDELGGVEIFNDVTQKFPNGRLYINKENINEYLNSIENPAIKTDMSFCVFVNLFHSASDYYLIFSSAKKFSSLLWQKLETNIPKRLALRIISETVENHSKLHLNYDRMNLDLTKEDGREIYLPHRQGIVDAQKLKQLTSKLIDFNPNLIRYPIDLQVKNTTSVYRLAARTAGVLRRKKCNVKEYLNSDIDLKKSLILDRCGSPVKREYLKKVTKINDVYYLIDYREDFDFTLYLGEDYYGISKINRQKID